MKPDPFELEFDPETLTYRYRDDEEPRPDARDWPAVLAVVGAILLSIAFYRPPPWLPPWTDPAHYGKDVYTTKDGRLLSPAQWERREALMDRLLED